VLIFDLTEDAQVPMSHDRHEIRARLSVIIIRQADGTPLGDVLMVSHEEDYKPICVRLVMETLICGCGSAGEARLAPTDVLCVY
jgi:hypothetical protein